MNISLLDCYLRDRDSIQSQVYEPEPGFFQTRMDGYMEDMMQVSDEELAVLSPTTKERIAIILSVYKDLKESADVIEGEMDAAKKEIFAALDREGVKKTLVDEIPLAIVRGTSTSLDKMRFVQLGGSLKMLEESMVSKPKKPYLKITLGKEKEE